ncbi:probable dolichyl-diphosphooligosaccharide--protein glycosyltransferase subunit 3B [Prosopis cineraria]|uniref:probable dolichyl-diphosphooligosaccharide--protein glycosyltransferase subunit 3B n=1 Tax=Prosopis cineraria TaxID=364024 RepID=UPI00240EC42A|nr:probable dolichyl-diphosphooligosaccharide--protein glycosyltransferase subunit 3B [Prosopis cineraria]
MTPFPKIPSFLLFIAICSLVAFNASSESADHRVRELLALQSKSKSGVIHLNDESVSRFLTSVETPRPYWVVVFFDAILLHNNPDLRLKDMLREFELVASSYIGNSRHPSSLSHAKLFFCKLDFRESKESFSLFGVDALPHLRIVAPYQSLEDSYQIDQGDWSRLAESMAEFIEMKTNLAVGPIHRPPIISRNKLILIGIGFLIWLVKNIIVGQTILHDPRVWLTGAVLVYFFSVSGAMHNIIRKVPMFLVDRKDRSKFTVFYRGPGMQLGLEGFCVGFFYTIVGLLLGYVTQALVKVNNVTTQRVVMIFALLFCFWAVRWVVFLSNWKSGYSVHGYWPSSWRGD